MISSTYAELKEHRAAVSQALLGHDMFPLDMANDAALSKDLIDASLAKVDKADGYIGLISYRYGQVIDDPKRNPDKLSLTELEFRRACDRGIPICMFIMGDDHPVPRSEVHKETATADKLAAFIALAKQGSICAPFGSVTDLSAKVSRSLRELQQELEEQVQARKAPKADTPPSAPSASVSPTSESISAPPAFHAHPSYIPGYAFQGRAKELAALHDWAGSADPVMLFEAIGGMGKSMVTWEWVTKHAETDNPNWAGRFWYSFYERGADMRDFCATALAYMTGGKLADLRDRPAAELADALLHQLRTRNWLLVLDGLERVLVAYNRFDAAQLTDAEADASTGATGGEPTRCIRPDDDDLLRQLAAATPSKLLISSRLMPLALLNAAGQPIPGVRRYQLVGLDPRDAEQMLRGVGITGDGERMRRDLERRFGCHPLVVGVVGGLVLKHFRAGGDYDRWADDPTGGGAVDLADPDIRQRQTHILKLAFDGLTVPERALLARIAMLTDAAEWETLEALNPQRPPPPEEVKPPGAPHAALDAYLRFLERQLAGANTQKQRAELEQQISERTHKRAQEYQAAQQHYADYTAAHANWLASPARRDASRWLTEALHDLDRRGLLQCDRQAGKVDLHPVVRGYAVASLDAEARTAAGQSVADHFAARPPPAYASVRNWLALANAVQVVQALNLAGRTQQAWGVLRGDLRWALYRLEQHHLLLALMRPWFPNGWSQPPEGIEDPDLVSNDAAVALKAIGLRRDAAAQEVFAIQQAIKRGLSADLSTRLRNHSLTVMQDGELAHRERLLALARDVAMAVGDDDRVLWCDVFLVSSLTEHGALPEARTRWATIVTRLANAYWRDGQLEAQALFNEAWLLHREGALTDAVLSAAIARTQALAQRTYERWLLYLAGDWHQAHHRAPEAIAAFTRAIELAHAVGLRDTNSEAGRGLSLARLGRTAEERAAAEAAERAQPHRTLAMLYLALGERDAARHHALAGYKVYWADGPPYAQHWHLEECRAVLRALGEAEPELPPYDPARIVPFAFEADIRRLLAEHAAKKKKEPE